MAAMDGAVSATEETIRCRHGYIPKEKKTFSENLKRKVQCNGLCLKNFIINFIPIITWLPKYPFLKYAMGDVLAGITTAVVRIPQGLAYGMLAGLDPINGLYTGFFSPIVYCIFGTSRHISVGVFSIISLMLGSALEKVEIDTDNYFETTVPSTVTTSYMDDTTKPEYESTTGANGVFSTVAAAPATDTEYTYEQRLAIIGSLTVLIGIILVLLGIFRLGVVAIFLSEPLVSGFTTGAAIYVLTAQLKHITGITLKRQSGAFGLLKTYHELFSRLPEIQWSAVILSAICLVILVPLKYVNRTYKKQLKNIPIPVELFIVIMGTVISAVVDLHEKYNIRIIGLIPSGMPSPVAPNISLWPVLIGDAISIAIVIFAVAVSLGKMFAKKHGYKIDPNQELLALGFCQMTNGLFQGHAGGGALARSTVQESSGCHTQVTGLVSCVILLMVLLLIGPFFEELPVACLSCIILVNLHGLLIQFSRLAELWRLDKFDFAIWLVTFMGVILFGVDLGLGVGLAFSLACGALRTNTVSVKELGQLPGTDLYREVDRFNNVLQVPSIKIIRFSQSPTYANKTSMQKIASDVVTGASKDINESDSGIGKVTNSNDGLGDGLTAAAASLEESLLVSPKCVIFDCSCWNFIDTVGMSTLQQTIEDLRAAKVQVLLAALSDELYSKLSTISMVGDDNALVKAYPSISHAVAAARLMLHTEDSTSHDDSCV